MSLPKPRPAVDVRAVIRARLVEIGMSRHALAAAAGISHQHLYAFLHEDEGRQKELSAVLLGRVLGVLGIELRGRRWKQRAVKTNPRTHIGEKAVDTGAKEVTANDLND